MYFITLVLDIYEYEGDKVIQMIYVNDIYQMLIDEWSY